MDICWKLDDTVKLSWPRLTGALAAVPEIKVRLGEAAKPAREAPRHGGQAMGYPDAERGSRSTTTATAQRRTAAWLQVPEFVVS